MHLPFIHSSATSSSPSLDMEAALQQLVSSSEPPDMSNNCFSSEAAPDILMMNPLLNYINEVLMAEGTGQDATCMQQQNTDAAYRAIMSSFSEIIGKHSLPDSSADSTGYEDNSKEHFVHRISAYNYNDSLDEKHVKALEQPNDGFTSTTNQVRKLGVPRAPLPAEGLINERLYSGKEHGNGHLDLKEIDVSLEDLKLVADYRALYIGESSLSGSSARAPRGSRQDGHNKQAFTVAGKRSRTSGNEGNSVVQGVVDLKDVLVSCAHAVSVGDTKRANEILQEVHLVHGASANGSALQRIAHDFSEALQARMRGLRGHEYRALCHNMPSAATILKASKLGFELAPYVKIMHYFANQTILKASEGASRLHIVDYGFLYGMQWPCLINALADRKGGPPLLVITGIESSQPGHYPAERLEESGQRLTAYARTYNVPFEFHSIVSSKWEDLNKASLHLHEDEVLIVNSMKRLRHIPDKSIDMDAASPREELLTHMHSLNPRLFLFADMSAALNSPYFVSRFREAIYVYSNVYDMLETLWGDRPQRLIMERNCFYREIINIVACEGAERVERTEPYKQWQVLIKRAGFEQLPICPTILSRSISHVKQHYHKDFIVHDDDNRWMLLGWKGRTVLASSVWKPSLV